MLAQAVRIERTWASFRATLGYQQPTPEEIWRAVKESNPARSVLETNPRPAPNPNWRMTVHSKTIRMRIHSVSGRFQRPGWFVIQDGGDSRSRTCTAWEGHHGVQAR